MKQTQNLTVDGVLALLEDVRTVAVCGHVNPDGDSVGSALALVEMLRLRGIEATSLLAKDQEPPGLYAILDDYHFMPAAQYTVTPDLFIAVDSPNEGRLGDAHAVLQRATTSLIIDHHPDHYGYADFYFGDDAASSTASLIWELIQASGIEASASMAAACYVGLMTDTGRFAYQNTNEQSFIDAGQMIATGIDPCILSQLVYESKPLTALQMEARLIDRVQFACDGRIAYSWICGSDFEDLNISRDDTEGLPAVLRSIQNVRVAALFREEGDSVRVNLRSREGRDVGNFACRFGGGGHFAAAGFTLKGKLSEVLDTVVPELIAMESSH
jgi:phosphoesterase RecJ-like protein